MAKINYTNTEDLPISCTFTLHDLKVLDRVLTDYIDPDQWGYEKSLHTEIRSILTEAHKQLGREDQYNKDRFEQVVEYTVKLKSKVDA